MRDKATNVTPMIKRHSQQLNTVNSLTNVWNNLKITSKSYRKSSGSSSMMTLLSTFSSEESILGGFAFYF